MRTGTSTTQRLMYLTGALTAIFLMLAVSSVQVYAQSNAPTTTHPPLRVTAYYLSDDAVTGRLPIDKIDFTAITHIIHFCLFPNSDGTFVHPFPPEQSAALVNAAHAAGVKVMISLGAQDNGHEVRDAVSDANRANLVKNLVDFVMSRGYDGVDLDYEPLEDRDVTDYSAFIIDLRHALDAAKPGLLITAAVASEPAMFAKLQGNFDQINLMTYSFSGPFNNFKSWYDSNLYGDPKHTMENKQPYPSCDTMIKQYLDAGIAPEKLAIGMGLGGELWNGVDGPRETIKGLKYVKADDGDDYRVIMDQYYQPSRYHWDPVAQAAYLSIKAPKPQDREFITLEDQYTCTAKVAYAKQQGLGGVMIWELGSGFRPNQPPGQQDLILQAIKAAKNDPEPVDPRSIRPPNLKS